MVLKPLILLLVVNEVCEEFPVAWRFLRSLYDKVVAFITKVRHRLHVDDLTLDMY